MSLELLLKSQRKGPITTLTLNAMLDAQTISELLKKADRETNALKKSIRTCAQTDNSFNLTPFKRFLTSQGITDLRDIYIRKDNASTPYSAIQQRIQYLLGIEEQGKTGKKERAQYVAKGIIEVSLERLGLEFAREILDEALTTKPISKEYFDEEVVGEIADENRKYIASTGILTEVLASKGIVDLRDVTKKRKGKRTPYSSIQFGIQGLLGFENPQRTGQKERAWYVARGIFEGDLSKIGEDTTREIVQDIFKGARSPAYDYFDPLVVGTKNAVANQKYLIETGILRAYLSERGIKSSKDVRQVDANEKPTEFTKTIAYKLGKITQLWEGSSTGPTQRAKLVEVGILPY